MTMQRPAGYSYRELWKTDRGDLTASVRVRLDGSEQIEEHPEFAPAEVRAYLRREQLHFVRLLRVPASEAPTGGSGTLRATWENAPARDPRPTVGSESDRLRRRRP